MTLSHRTVRLNTANALDRAGIEPAATEPLKPVVDTIEVLSERSESKGPAGVNHAEATFRQAP